MSKLDDAIRDALAEEDAAFLARFEREPTLLAQATGVFTGPMGWLNLVFAGVLAAAFAVFLVAAWKFAVAPDVVGQLRWGGVGFVSLTLAVLIRIWFWMEIHTGRVVREIKRLELQVARLTARDAV